MLQTNPLKRKRALELRKDQQIGVDGLLGGHPLVPRWLRLRCDDSTGPCKTLRWLRLRMSGHSPIVPPRGVQYPLRELPSSRDDISSTD